MDINCDVITYVSKNLNLRRPGVAIFAEIIKIVTMFIKTIFKDSIQDKKELKIMYQNSIYIYIF